MRRVEKATYARTLMGIDPISGEPARRWHPYYVRIPTHRAGILLTGADRYDGVFIYAQNAGMAATNAAKLWNVWIKQEQGLTDDDYPKTDIDELWPTIQIDDNDYDTYWKDAKKLPHRFTGDTDSPVAYMTTTQEILEYDRPDTYQYNTSDARRKNKRR